MLYFQTHNYLLDNFATKSFGKSIKFLTRDKLDLLMKIFILKSKNFTIVEVSSKNINTGEIIL